MCTEHGGVPQQFLRDVTQNEIVEEVILVNVEEDRAR